MATRKTATKKAAPRKATARKVAPRKAAPRKVATRKVPRQSASTANGSPDPYDRAFPGADPAFPPPAFLADVAKAKWVELVPVLLARRDATGQSLLDPTTRDSLALFCDAWAEFDAACRALATLDRPWMYVGDGGAMQAHPAVAMKKAARAELRSSAKLLGLNPVSRSSLKSKEAGAKSKVAEILGRAPGERTGGAK